MSTLKERFEDFSVKPDEKVWENINKTLNHKVAVRRWAIGGSAVAVLAVAAAVAFIGFGKGEETGLVAENQNVTVIANQQNVSPAESGIIEATPAPSVQPASDAAVVAVGNTTQQNMNPVASVAAPAPTVAQNVQTPQPFKAPSLHIVADQSAMRVSTADMPMRNNVVAPNLEAPANDGNADSPAPATKPAPKVEKANPITTQEELVVWIPNAFAPDAVSEKPVQQFRVVPNDDANIVSFEMFIYSRAGRLVYHSKDINAGWDGTFNGHAQPTGTYTYIIEINDATKGIQHTRGSVTLIR